MSSMKSPAATLLSNVELPTDITLSQRDLCDLEMLLMGAFAPLEGYHNFSDFCSVVTNNRLANGTLWPMPIVLSVPKNQIKESENAVVSGIIKLRDIVGTVLAEVHVEDCYEPDIDVMAEGILGTNDMNHPFMQHLKQQGVVFVGGKTVRIHPIIHFDFLEFRKSPAEVKKEIEEKGWKVVVGFQTRNPLHRSHFELTRQALQEAAEMTGESPHLLLTPACGPTQPGDIDYHVRVRCYKKIIPFYKDICGEEAGLILLPLAMRMAGPKEALWHALIRKNFGCTHFIVGRDHAGPSRRKQDGSSFYGPYEAHELLQSYESEIGIKTIFGKNLLYLGDNGGYVQEDKVPEGTPSLQISGTRFREMLENREEVPSWYSFTPVVEELQNYYRKRQDLGFCLYFTGLPCSGKSTLATAMEAALLEREQEKRQVTIFDADVIRTHLSKGLGFSKEDRQVNVQRIGYVSSLVVKHNGICVVANIAPYEEDRMFNRKMISASGGGYIEIYVSTPLEVCEERDVKELYKKARMGVIKQFTGISDPYEVPKNPELIVDSSEDILGKVNVILEYLTANGWIV